MVQHPRRQQSSEMWCSEVKYLIYCSISSGLVKLGRPPKLLLLLLLLLSLLLLLLLLLHPPKTFPFQVAYVTAKLVEHLLFSYNCNIFFPWPWFPLYVIFPKHMSKIKACFFHISCPVTYPRCAGNFK